MRPPALRTAGPTVLVAAVFLLTVELLRASGPLLDLSAERLGVVGAARLALLIFMAPVLIGPVVRVIGAAWATVGAVAGLVVLRLAAQAVTPDLAVVGAGAVLGIAALVLVVRQVAAIRSGVTVTVGVLLGTVADLAVRVGYGTWDAIWRPGWLPWLVPAVAGAAAAAALVLVRPRLGTTPGGGRVGALGPYLALYVMAYGSAAFVASQAGVPLPVATVVLLGAALLGMELVRRITLAGGSGAITEPDRWFAGAAALLGLGAGVAGGYWLTGLVVLPAVVVAALSAAVLLARAVTPRGIAGAAGRDTPAATGWAAGWAAGWSALAAGLGYVLPVLVYQVHYDLGFPFDNRWVLVVAAVLLGLAGMGRRPLPTAGRGRLLARPALLSSAAASALLVPLAVLVTGPSVPEPDQAGVSVRLMSWNVKYGRHDTHGGVDPESVAAAVEAAAPDVVLLQEVSRGWPIGGTVDMAEWLARRLEMRYEWSPAADGQFGNLLLTRLPVTEVAAVRLPFVQGPMQRSYLAVTLALDGGRELRVINTHLQHRKANTPTRLAQSTALLERWGGAPGTIIAGDFNFYPSWPEPALFFAEGFASAQDETGHGARYTAPSAAPDNRIDWIFGTPDLGFSDFAILSEVTNSDHLPLVVTVTVGARR